MQSEKKVFFNLSEHDASQLLALVKKEISQEDKIWHPYWKRLAKVVESAIENSAHPDALKCSSWVNDVSDG